MNTKPIDYSSASLLIGQTRRGALIVQCPGDVWLDIQLADQAEGALPAELQRLVGKRVSPEDIRAVLPDWSSLQWEQIPPSDLSSGEWVARVGRYRVNIYGHPGSAVWHDQVMVRVQNWMGADQPRSPERS